MNPPPLQSKYKNSEEEEVSLYRIRFEIGYLSASVTEPFLAMERINHPTELVAYLRNDNLPVPESDLVIYSSGDLQRHLRRIKDGSSWKIETIYAGNKPNILRYDTGEELLTCIEYMDVKDTFIHRSYKDDDVEQAFYIVNLEDRYNIVDSAYCVCHTGTTGDGVYKINLCFFEFRTSLHKFLRWYSRLLSPNLQECIRIFNESVSPQAYVKPRYQNYYSEYTE